MSRLVMLRSQGGPEQEYPLKPDQTLLGRGRQPDVDVPFDSPEISRQHARVTADNGHFFLEDLGSRNGTFLNGNRLTPHQRVEIQNEDQIKLGPNVLIFRTPLIEDPGGVVIRSEVLAHSSNMTLFRQDASQKLQAVLEIAQQLARTLELTELLPRLLDHLLKLFTQTDRALILMREADHLVVKAMKVRLGEERMAGPIYSRTIAARVLKEGVGIVAEDASQIAGDTMATVNVMGVRSFMCVPFKTHDGQTVGLLQLDSFELGRSFSSEDLHLLTTISLQVSVVLENAALHAEVLQQERFKRDLALAREIQEGFMPHDFSGLAGNRLDLFAKVFPARDVSGDFYDCFALDPQRIAFVVADVMGKGIPAALFMVAVRTLGRHMALTAPNPAAILQNLNDTLAADNPKGMFVTMIFGVYHISNGEVVLCCAGHPPPYVRRQDGRIEPVQAPPGRLLGFSRGALALTETRFPLAPRETLFLYSDGITDAVAPDGKTRFGIEQVEQSLRRLTSGKPLDTWAGQMKTDVDRFTTKTDLYDDITLMFLRRP